MLAALLAACLAAPAAALFGSSTPGVAVLWVPPESFSDWPALDAALAADDGLKLTAALTPSMLTLEAKKALAPWLASGRLETALRLEGDPVLPLVAAHPAAPRPDDLPARLSLARERWRVELGTAPAGFVPGAGAVSAELFDALRAVTPAWTAAGEYAPSTAAWSAAGVTLLVPARAVRTEGRELSAEDLGLDETGAPVLVVDEADGLVPEGSLLRLLRSPGGRRSRRGWATISEASSGRAAEAKPAARAAEWPAWLSLATWTKGPRAAHAWALYAHASQTLDRYQNSGGADLKALETASLDLYAAQANRFFRELPPGESEAAARAHRGHLLGVYRKLKQTPPEALFKSGPSAGEGQTTDVHVAEGSDWIQFDNPSGSFGRAPDGFQLEAGGAPGAAFKLERLRVEPSGPRLSFIFKLGKLDSGVSLEPSAAAAPDLGRVLLEAYIDVNHVAGAGSSTLLFDRSTFVVARDAWEYALTISAWGAYLYKANPLGTPLQLARLDVSADPSTREVRVSVPRALLKGNALRWGYVAAASLADPRSAAKPPVKPLKAGEGSTVLGILGPLEQQKALFDAKASRPRLAAVRAR